MWQQDRPVVVVGAGAAGIYAASLLKNERVPVVIVEAAPHLGGRTKAANFIHGEKTFLADFARQLELTHFDAFSVFARNPERPLTEYFFIGRERRLLPLHTDDPDVKKMYDLIAELGKTTPKEDLSLLQYLANKGLPYRTIALADAIYAKTWGTSMHKLSAREYSFEQNSCLDEGGEGNLFVKNSMIPILRHLAKDVEIKTNWEVSKIDYTHPDAIKVINTKQEEIIASQVIITVPLRILQDNDITFVPSLPTEKRRAINTLTMDAGMKIYVTFKKSFWPENHHLILCSDSFVPQFWMYTAEEPVVIGFLTGDVAKNASSLPQEQVIDTFVKQLDAVYGVANKTDPELARPASTNVKFGSIHDWTQEKYIRGCYSSATVGSEGCRKLLAQPVGQSLFFAGEATHPYFAATVHGAMETGKRAVAEVVQNRQKSARL